MQKKKKQRRMVGLILLVIVLILPIVILFMTRSGAPKLIFKKDLTVEVGSNVVLRDLVKKVENGTLVNEKQTIPTTKLGKQKVTVEVKNKKGKKKKQSFEVKVVDSIKPEITGVRNLETSVGVEVDLMEGITATDNSQEDISVRIEGNYHFDQVGKYALFYVAKDSSGNETKVPFELVVLEEQKRTSTSSKTFRSSNGYTIKQENGLTYVDGYLIANKTYSLPDDYGNGLTKEAQDAFAKMKEAALSEGISLTIISGFRSYASQRSIYNNYVARDGREEADTYSARPGHSEHQTGLAMDINSLEVSFEETAEGKWLNQNCARFGFIIRYPKGKSEETGYMYEPWHIRYVGESLAKKLYRDGNWITMETYFGLTSRYE